MKFINWCFGRKNSGGLSGVRVRKECRNVGILECFLVCIIPVIFLFHFSFAQKNTAFLLHEWNALLIEQMLKDGINPLLATRTFSYTNIAAYETISYKKMNSLHLSGKLNGLQIQLKNFPDSLNFTLAAIQAFYSVAKIHSYRENECDSLIQNQYLYIKKIGISDEFFQKSIAFGNEIASQINAWAKSDGYLQTKARSNYIFNNEESKWKPSPPEFRNALEPHWATIRTFTIDSSDMFSEPFYCDFSNDTVSEFYKMAYEVYSISKKRSPEHEEIAQFWDDNPDMNTFTGHFPFPRRHLSPPSHWISVINQICVKENYNFERSAKIYALASVAMADAMICVWHDKYKYEVIRPVTYIRNYIDPDWMPLIVTPPFPEFPSGHSALSKAAASILTELIGENYSFTDSTLVPFGMKSRNFSSFNSAAEEVSLSRIYGGIHYDFSVKQGLIIGQKVANNILEKMKEKDSLLIFKTLGGKNFIFSEINKHKITAFVFLSPECPLCLSYTLTLKEIYQKYDSSDIKFYGVFPGKYYSKRAIRKFVKKYGLQFPMLLDPEYVLTKKLRAAITPEVFVLDSSGSTLYKGQIDNWVYEQGKKRTVITEFYLKDALDSVLRKEEIKVKKTEAIGCFIFAGEN